MQRVLSPTHDRRPSRGWIREVPWRLPRVVPSIRHRERGMTTAEYAIGTIAAAGFAALLMALLSSDEVRELLFDIVRSALSSAG